MQFDQAAMSDGISNTEAGQEDKEIATHPLEIMWVWMLCTHTLNEVSYICAGSIALMASNPKSGVCGCAQIGKIDQTFDFVKVRPKR